jgi:hypothetical protein
LSQREVTVSPNEDGSHWDYHGKTLYLIGKGMVKMLGGK